MAEFRLGVTCVLYLYWSGVGGVSSLRSVATPGVGPGFFTNGGGARARFSSRAPCSRAIGPVCLLPAPCVAGLLGGPTGGFGLLLPAGFARWFAVGSAASRFPLGMVCRLLRGLGVMTGCAASYAASPAFRRALRSCFEAGSGRGVFLSHPPR